MVNELTKLYNTLATIATKGEDTKTMSDCLRYTEQLITEAKQDETVPVETKPAKTKTSKSTTA